MRHEPTYIDRTIAAVRNHRGADNCWPQWANIFADTIEDLQAENKRLRVKGDRYVRAVWSVWRSCPNYGSEGCTCGIHATPDRDCPIHWAVERLERHGVGYEEARETLASAARGEPK